MREKKFGWGTIIAVVIVAAVIFGNSENKKRETETEAYKIEETEKQTTYATEKSYTGETGVTGIDVKRDYEYGDIQDYYYEIVGDAVALGSYNGRAPIIELKTSYVIDGKEYKTDLSEFKVGIGDNHVKTVIFSEGFSALKNSVFNSCDVENVYFPRSMTEVYDDTLAYLEPKTQEKIKIYYGGTQDEWYGIFKKYQRTKVEDAEFGEELGTAIADKLNEMIGHEYDSSKFEYFFSANPDDLKK